MTEFPLLPKSRRPPTVKGYFTDDRGRQYARKPDGSCRTEQHHVDQTSIREIVKRARAGHVITHLNRREPFFGDLTQAGDLHQMMETVRNAQESFDSLPSAARTLADNDPVRFLELVEEGNSDLLKAAGLQAPDSTLRGPTRQPDKDEVKNVAQDQPPGLGETEEQTPDARAPKAR